MLYDVFLRQFKDVLAGARAIARRMENASILFRFPYFPPASLPEARDDLGGIAITDRARDLPTPSAG